MTNATSIIAILTQYQRLCQWCDNTFNAIAERYPQEISCRQGCSDCCKLTSVGLLEAVHVKQFLDAHPHNSVGPGSTSDNPQDACAFLVNHECAIYPARPIICRTHGLPLLDRTEEHDEIDVCPRNFAGSQEAEIDKDDIVDMSRINDNLARLTIALAMAMGKRELSDRRFGLWDIFRAKFPSDLNFDYGTDLRRAE